MQEIDLSARNNLLKEFENERNGKRVNTKLNVTVCLSMVGIVLFVTIVVFMALVYVNVATVTDRVNRELSAANLPLLASRASRYLTQLEDLNIPLLIGEITDYLKYLNRLNISNTINRINSNLDEFQSYNITARINRDLSVLEMFIPKLISGQK